MTELPLGFKIILKETNLVLEPVKSRALSCIFELRVVKSERDEMLLPRVGSVRSDQHCTRYWHRQFHLPWSDMYTIWWSLPQRRTSLPIVVRNSWITTALSACWGMVPAPGVVRARLLSTSSRSYVLSTRVPVAEHDVPEGCTSRAAHPEKRRLRFTSWASGLFRASRVTWRTECRGPRRRRRRPPPEMCSNYGSGAPSLPTPFIATLALQVLS